ncbi:PqqD family protein [Micromonospora sp. NPDC000316]|uniref:PqqD family protein n=1 Tax=Micromonospora sp. NPDC000316 TaxID=3364216 RepID=UPI0036AABA95
MIIDDNTVLAAAENLETRQYLKGLVIEPGLSLNEVGAFVFGLVDGHRSVAGIVEAMTQEYDVPADECRQDVVELLTQLTESGALVSAVPAGTA